MNELVRYNTEDFPSYCYRILEAKKRKQISLTYSEIWQYLFNEDITSDAASRRFRGIEYLLNFLLEEKAEREKNLSRMEQIKEKIDSTEIIKRQLQMEKNELARLKRELIKSLAISEDLKDFIKENCSIVIPNYCKTPITQTSPYEMILVICDWHIGYVIRNCHGNSFNWEMANTRVDKLIEECMKYIKLYNIKKIHVMNLGDMIEHVSMRKNQYQFCEFGQSEQINRSLRLIYRLLVTLNKKCNIEYESTYGNHDRMNGEKEANQDGDNAETIITQQLGIYNELTNNKRLKIIPNEYNDKEIIKEIMGIKCKFVHGMGTIYKEGRAAVKNDISMDNEFYDILVKAHLHNYKVESENRGRYVVSCGCLSGANDYSRDFGCQTHASQTLMILAQNRIEIIKDIQLQ